MATIGDALQQAFMPKHDYDEILPDDQKPQRKLNKPLILFSIAIICLAVFISTAISLKIVFPDDKLRRPFCRDFRNQSQSQSINFKTTPSPVSGGGGMEEELDPSSGAFILSLVIEDLTVEVYWMVLQSSALLFASSVMFLVAGILVAYTAPTRHECLNVVVDNNCASGRGRVRCLSILNLLFAILFGLLALFNGSFIFTRHGSCAMPLFWCYEIASWGLVTLHGGAALFLRRKDALDLDESEFSGRNIGLEMLETRSIDIEKQVNEGF